MRLTRFHTMALAFALGGWLAANAKADPIPIDTPISYYTVGSIGGPGDPNGPVTFHGVGGSSSPGVFMLPGTFSLGSLTAPALPSTASLTYDNTPFTVDAYVSSTPGGPGWPYVDVRFTGTLNGTVTGSSTSSLLASVSSITQVGGGTLPFPIQNLSVDSQLLIPGGLATPLIARAIDAAGQVLAVPEPTSVVLFGSVLLGLGFRRWARVARQADPQVG